jgi:hypothetical protein
MKKPTLPQNTVGFLLSFKTTEWQMGTSVLMLERHYSKLTATLAAGQLD